RLRGPVGEGGVRGETRARLGGVVKGRPAMNRADNVGPPAIGDVLEQVATGPRPDRLEEILLLIADRQYDDLRAGGDLLHRTSGLDPAALWHPDVHQDHVRQRLTGLLDRLRAVARLAHQFQAGLLATAHLT